MIEYPKMRYHKDGTQCIVHNADEEAALSAEWGDPPGAESSDEDGEDSDPEEPASEAAPVKRGRGRPRKNP